MAKKEEREDPKKWKRIDRIGHVTIYKRGPTYHLYYRENGQSLKVPVGRDLNAARKAASEVNSQLHDEQPSTFNFERITVPDFAKSWVGHCRDVRGLSYHTLTRYEDAIVTCPPSLYHPLS